MPLCIVSYVDLDGIRHSVEVEAEGLYEAAILGIVALRKHDCEPGPVAQIDVEVRSKITQSITVNKAKAWLARGVRSPNEAVLKDRLRRIL